MRIGWEHQHSVTGAQSQHNLQFPVRVCSTVAKGDDSPPVVNCALHLLRSMLSDADAEANIR